ncbi:hypothetical protein CKK33_18550 [Mucilaginibacter sp. MD40]|nr:hypothetical protein CKK33_18550 [Mucilaginibacter sp. MD40]
MNYDAGYTIIPQNSIVSTRIDTDGTSVTCSICLFIILPLSDRKFQKKVQEYKNPQLTAIRFFISPSRSDI